MRTILLSLVLLMVAVMVVLVIAGAHQFLSVLVPLAVFPLLIGVGGLRRMVRERNK